MPTVVAPLNRRVGRIIRQPERITLARRHAPVADAIARPARSIINLNSPARVTASYRVEPIRRAASQRRLHCVRRSGLDRTEKCMPRAGALFTIPVMKTSTAAPCRANRSDPPPMRGPWHAFHIVFRPALTAARRLAIACRSACLRHPLGRGADRRAADRSLGGRLRNECSR